VLTWTHGSHTISAGVDIDGIMTTIDLPASAPATFGFANLLDFAQDQPFDQSGPAMTVANGALASDLYRSCAGFTEEHSSRMIGSDAPVHAQFGSAL